MVIIDKTKNKCKIIDFACPVDSRIEEREKDKMKQSKKRIKENMGYACESNPCSTRCIKNNIKEIKAAFE